jgi:hypothetical protein
MKKLIIFILSGMLLLASGARAQQIVPGNVNQYLKEGYSINSIISVGDKGFAYHLIKGKELITCIFGTDRTNIATVCFKP